jgi:Flp pilus assembly CpaF family ATPase
LNSSFRHFNVRLEREQWARLSVLADERQQSVAEIIRAALNVYLGTADLLTSSQRRIARISEFQQIALDLIIQEQYPEYRERIIAEANKRLEQYHGA